jgi:hypothetical protein
VQCSVKEHKITWLFLILLHEAVLGMFLCKSFQNVHFYKLIME